MRVSILPSIPFDTARVARSVFPQTNSYIQVGDRIEELLNKIDSGQINRAKCGPQELPVLWALISSFQFNERLTDEQAVDAVRLRIDWQYALHLPSYFPALNPTALCHFRIFAYSDPETMPVFQLILELLQRNGFFNSDMQVPAGGVCKNICCLNRYTKIFKRMQAALEVLSEYDPEFMRQYAAPYWYKRYQGDPYFPPEECQTAAEVVGKDILQLIKLINTILPNRLSSLPEILLLRQVLEEQYVVSGLGISTRLALKWSNKNCIFLSGETLAELDPQQLCYGLAIH